MAYRSTPLDTTGYSPAQLLMGRNIRTQLPTLPINLVPAWPDFDVVQCNDKRTKERSALNFNKRKGARYLPAIKIGQQVRVRLPKDKEWSLPDKIVGKQNNSSYAIRNRNFLQMLPDDFKTIDARMKGFVERQNENANGSGGEEVSVTPVPLPRVVGCKPPDSVLSDPSSVVPVVRTRYGRTSVPVHKYQA
jgi:hypothetical protein